MMNYDIKLYAHGVPKGQCSWGVSDYDSNYIDSFYGRKSSVPTQMLVEVKKFGTNINCYYTYYRTGTCDCTGRSGGYFALTLRINYYYADVQNIYNLLDVAFKKFIVGSIVDLSEGVVKYRVADFSQSDSTLQALELEVNKYLMQFSTDSDFVSLDGFLTNGQNDSAMVNTVDCNAKSVMMYVRSNGSISISPHHTSSQVQQLQQKVQTDINAAKKQAEQEIAAIQRDKEQSIQSIRDEYKNADYVITTLRQDIGRANQEITRLSGIVNELKAKLQYSASYKDKYEKVEKELSQKNALIEKIRDAFSSLGGIQGLLGANEVSRSGKTDRGNKQLKDRDSNSFANVIRRIHPFMDLFVMILLLGIIGVTMPNSCTGKDTPFGELFSQVKESGYSDINQGTDNSGDVVDETGGNREATEPDVEDSQLIETLKQNYPSARIDIAEISENNPMRYGNGNNYTVSIRYLVKNLSDQWVWESVDKNLGGQWVSDDFEIQGNKIIPKHSGNCCIDYVISNYVFISRTINVKD